MRYFKQTPTPLDGAGRPGPIINKTPYVRH